MTAQRTEKHTKVIVDFLATFVVPSETNPELFYCKITDADAAGRLNTLPRLLHHEQGATGAHREVGCKQAGCGSQARASLCAATDPTTEGRDGVALR